MDVVAFLKLLAGASSAGQVGVPVTQEPRYMAEEDKMHRPLLDSLISTDPSRPSAKPLWGELANILATSADALNRRGMAPEMRQDADGEYSVADPVKVLKDILRRDTGRTAR